MLTSLSWMQEGQPWPIPDQDEQVRLLEHIRNRQIYDDLHEVFQKYSEYLKDEKNKDKKVPIFLSWPKNATGTYIDQAIGETPDIKITGIQEAARLIAELHRTDEEALVDLSRFGLMVFEISEQKGLPARIEAINPENVLFVIKAGDIRTVTAYVIFSEFERDLKKYVYFRVHTSGQIQHLVYEIKAGKLASTSLQAFFPDLKTLENGIQKTGVQEPLVIVAHNELTTDRYYGRSHYTRAVCSVLEALELAFAERAEVLATFTRPVPIVPESACTYDHAKGKWVFNTDEAIVIQDGTTAGASVLTWDPQLGDLDKHISDLFQQLLGHLQLSSQLIAGEKTGSGDPSGLALEMLILPTTSRVKRMRSALWYVIPKVLSLASKLEQALGYATAQPFEESAVSITWKKILPQDRLALAQEISIYRASGDMSLRRSLQLQGLEGEALDAEIAELEKEKASSAAQIPELNLPGIGE